MIGFLLKHWKVALAVFGAVVIALGLWTWYVNDTAYDRGVAAEKAKNEKALFEAQQKALFEMAKMEKGYDSALKKIRATPAGGCVGPANARSLEWMQEHYLGE